MNTFRSKAGGAILAQYLIVFAVSAGVLAGSVSCARAQRLTVGPPFGCSQNPE